MRPQPVHLAWQYMLSGPENMAFARSHVTDRAEVQ